MTRFFLVRHGETEWNKIRRIQGVSDIPLNDTGRAQAAALGDILASHTFDLLVSSPLSRAVETATIIAARVKMPGPLIVPELIERNYGEAEGSNGGDLDIRYPAGAEVPGRESREAVMQRTIRAMQELAISHPEADVLAVAHGGVIRSAVEYAAPGLHNEPITNCSVHSFRYDAGSLELVAFDDPMEDASRFLGVDEFEEQNPAETRERPSRG